MRKHFIEFVILIETFKTVSVNRKLISCLVMNTFFVLYSFSPLRHKNELQ